MHSEKVLNGLKKAGWYEGRCIDIEPYMAILSKLYPTIPDVVKDVLREYGGLVIIIPRPDKIYNEIDFTQILNLIPWKPCYAEDRIYEPRINSDLFYIGDIWSGYFGLDMTPDGKAYAYNGSLLYLGSSFDEMLENAFTPNFIAEEIL